MTLSVFYYYESILGVVNNSVYSNLIAMLVSHKPEKVWKKVPSRSRD